MFTLAAAFQELGGLGGTGWAVIAAIGLVVVFFIFVLVWASRYKKVGPNHVLIIYGRRHKIRDAQGRASRVGYRIVKGGGAFVWPIIEQYQILSLEILTIDVKTPEAVYTVQGVPVEVDGVAQIKIRGDENSIRTAAEQFLSKDRREIMNVALQTLEGHLRAMLGTMTVEEIYKNRDRFAQEVQETAARDMANMGLHIVSFTIRDIRDSEGYLDALGKPRTAEVKRDAIIAQAEADRDSMIRSAEANRAGQEARYVAETKIAEANRNYEMKKADYQASINDRRAQADLAYDLQKYKTGQAVKQEEIQVQIVEKQKRIEVQEAETLRKEKELSATVEKPAAAEKYRIQTLADAEKYKLQTEAEGQAEAVRDIGTGEADANKARGLAQADVIQAQGESEAVAMEKKAAAWQKYNEAAIVQMFIDKMPEIVSAISAPLAKTDKIVIVSTGGDGAGASKVTKDVVNIAAQLPPMLEALTGMDLQQLIKRIPLLKEAPQAKEKNKK
jgi:flotillin